MTPSLPDSTPYADSMLSNPTTITTTDLHPAALPTIAQRRRQHRRQNSTPMAFDTVKIAKTSPNKPRRSPPTAASAGAATPTGGHRRGLSLDTRRQHIRQRSLATAAAEMSLGPSPMAAKQDFGTVSISTNTGFTANNQQQQQQQQQQQHHVLLEAQQQCLQAGPGSFIFPMPGTPQQSTQQLSNHNDNYLISPHADPQAQGFNAAYFDPSAMPYGLNVAQRSRAQSYASHIPLNANDFFTASSPLSTPVYGDFLASPTATQGWNSEGEMAVSRRASRRVSNGIIDRVAKFENLVDANSQSPPTSPNQTANNCLPTPEMESAVPVKQEKPSPRPDRFSEGYDESLEETIKPTKRRPVPPKQNIFEEMRRQAEKQQQPQQPQQPQHRPIAPAAPPPHRANTMPEYHTSPEYRAMPISRAADFLDMDNFNSEILKIRSSYNDARTPSVGLAPAAELTLGQPCKPGTLENLPDLRPFDSVSQPTSPARSQRQTPSTKGHRRTESLASIASAASISSINIEETRTDTGITLEDIAAYIRGPEPHDNRWVCVYPECNKRFGRKENIKSHVQTHLNDRQYQCPTCLKCFVRQHDLKRHAKIHTGVKPYPCECGNSFARHDALTRHRQRGMCIGAFDGVVRKPVKRGRPRKNRPGMEERVDKASRARRKNNMSVSSVSSFYSDASSGADSPGGDNGYDMLDGHGFDLVDMPISAVLAPGMSATAEMPVLTSAVDLSGLQGYANSPEAVESLHTYVSPADVSNHHSPAPPAPSSPAKSTASQINEPPELSQSSSPPPNATAVEEAVGAAPGLPPFAVSSSATTAMQNMAGALTVGLGVDQAEEMMFGGGVRGKYLLEQDASSYGLGKFDEDFENVMMSAEDDMFYGQLELS